MRYKKECGCDWCEARRRLKRQLRKLPTEAHQVKRDIINLVKAVTKMSGKLNKIRVEAEIQRRKLAGK